jgi:hypothetical protein
MTIQEYTQKLAAILSLTLSRSDVTAVIAETTSHLTDRAEELRAASHSTVDAERLAVEEFGEVSEIAVAIATEFPPRPPIDPADVWWVPEVLLAMLLALATIVFSNSVAIVGTRQAVHSVIAMYLGAMPMMVVPGFFASLSRIKYRRFVVIAMVRRLALYGVILAGIGATAIVCLRWTGNETHETMDYVYLGFAALTCMGYCTMAFLSCDGKAQDAFFQRFRRS